MSDVAVERRRIRAKVLRDLFLEAARQGIDPHGIRIRGAQVEGDLDLEEVDAKVAVRLRDCIFEKIILSGATLRLLDLSGSHLSTSDGPALACENLTVSGPLFLSRGFRAEGTGDLGAVRLSGARVGFLDLSGSDIRNTSGPALRASRLRIEGDLYAIGGFKLAGTGDNGAFRFLGGRVDGQLWLVDGFMENPNGPAFNGENLEVAGDFLWEQRVSAVGAGDSGVLYLAGARIGGALLCEGSAASLDHAGIALVADGAVIKGEFGIHTAFACRADGKNSGDRTSWTSDGLVSLDGTTYPAYRRSCPSISGSTFSASARPSTRHSLINSSQEYGWQAGTSEKPDRFYSPSRLISGIGFLRAETIWRFVFRIGSLAQSSATDIRRGGPSPGSSSLYLRL